MEFESLFASRAFEEVFSRATLPQTNMPSHTVQEAKAHSVADSD